MIVHTLTANEFAHNLNTNHGFSYAAGLLLFDDLEEFYEGECYEVDYVTLKCEWSEYTLKDYALEYMDEQDYTDDEILDHMTYHTTAIGPYYIPDDVTARYLISG